MRNIPKIADPNFNNAFISTSLPRTSMGKVPVNSPSQLTFVLRSSRISLT
jgi:hypothetical protein